MGDTRYRTLGFCLLPTQAVPARSSGMLGRKDAGDPDSAMCMAGDTSGSIGLGGDLGAVSHSGERTWCEATVPVLAVDLDKMRRFLYTVAYAEEVDKAARRGFASAEIQLGNQPEIEAAARNSADGLMGQLQQTLEGGPDEVASLISALEERRARARASLNTKLSEAQRVGNRWVSLLGVAVKGLSAIKFTATVTVKTLEMFTGPAGTGVDWTYSAVQAGLKQGQSNAKEPSVAGVVVEETGKNIAQEVGEWLNECVAEGLMTTAEKNKFEGLIGNYRGNARKLGEQIEALEEKIRKAMEAGKDSKIAGLTRRSAEKLEKLSKLRQKTLSAALRKGARGGAVKTAAGRTLKLVFLADDLKEAWQEAAQEWRASD
jgi:hypothetical protein